MFTKQSRDIKQSGVFLKGEELEIVSEFKYLGLTLDSTLSFKKHVKKISNKVKFNLRNFKQNVAAKVFLHSMILSHMEYCCTSWTLTGMKTFKSIELLYKNALKVLDKKPMSFHICKILQKHNILSIENLIFFKYAGFVYKVLHGLAPPPLLDFFKLNTNSGARTRASVRGDCEVPFRRTAFGQNSLSVKACKLECSTFPIFKTRLKVWLIANQSCDH